MNKTNEKTPMMERNHDVAQKYASMLRACAEQMAELAEQLGKGGRALTAGERQLVRFATVPALKEMFDEVLFLFIAGQNPVELPQFKEIVYTCDELTGNK